MTITAEQVARAIEAARADEGGISDALGGWQWDKRAPDYVRVAWGKPSLPDFIAALTRWHAELVAVATQRAAEAERADKPDHLAYADSPVWDDGPLPTPTPERPAPRFKVGDWARDRDTVFRVAEMHWDDDRWHARPVAGVRDGIAEYSLQPASPPAHEVVDVPQPVVKRVSGVMVSGRDEDQYALWSNGESVIALTFVRNDSADSHESVSVALLRAMLEAIDAQQPAPVQPARPEPRYKVGDWVRVEGTGTVYQIGEIAGEYFRKMPGSASVSYKLCALTPAIDPALHETARKTVAWLRSCRGGWADGYEARKALPGHREWDLEHKDNERWAAHLERLLGDAP